MFINDTQMPSVYASREHFISFQNWYMTRHGENSTTSIADQRKRTKFSERQMKNGLRLSAVSQRESCGRVRHLRPNRRLRDARGGPPRPCATRRGTGAHGSPSRRAGALQTAGQAVCPRSRSPPPLSRTYASDPTQVICVSCPSQLSAFPVTAAGLANGVVMRGCIISNLSVYTTLLE